MEQQKRIQAVLFDMDGLLIDSEPLWRRAMKTVFDTVGLELTEKMCASTMGYRMDEVVELWSKRFPWTNKSNAQVNDEIIAEVCRLVRAEGKPMPGVAEAIALFQQENIPMSVASSSSMLLINTVLDHLNLKPVLAGWHSAEFEEYGKPHPQVFISAAQQLNVLPENCLVFEDSLNGAIAGKAAKCIVVAIPEPDKATHLGFGVADVQLNSLTEFTQDTLTQLQNEF